MTFPLTPLLATDSLRDRMANELIETEFRFGRDLLFGDAAATIRQCSGLHVLDTESTDGSPLSFWEQGYVHRYRTSREDPERWAAGIALALSPVTVRR